MPIYHYRCSKGHEFEALQSMSDDALTKCEECGAKVERVLHAPAVHFKGSGFYTTDYARAGKGPGGGSQGESKPSSGDGGTEKKSDGAEKKKDSSSAGNKGKDKGGGKTKSGSGS